MLWVFVPVAGLILPVIILFLTRSKKTKCKIRKVGEPDRPITYDISDLTIPRMSGKSMLLMKWLATSWIKNILGAESIRKSGLDKLRTIDIPDCPTIIPLPLPSCNPPTIEDNPIDFESFLTVDRKSYKSSFKFLSISDLTAAYRSGKVTPLRVAKRIIECIQNSDEKNPKMRAFTQYNKDEILGMAQASTQRYSDSAVLSFLDGVPVGLKEEFEVVPYFQQNGTTFWSKEPCDHDASVVKKLRDGGAMIIGMTNMHEIGIGVTGNNPNRLHGTPRNPYNVNYYTGGSSSGSAAAVASGLCLVGLGTDGGGSVRMPAGACGVVGIKASFGRINTAGVVHTAHTVSHAGPICNSVQDAALVYAYIAGPDPQDMCSISQPPVSLQGFNQTTLNGVRVGIDWNYFKHTDKEVFDQCEQAAKYLEGCGAKIVSVQIPELEETRVAHTITILVEMASGLNSMFDEYFDELNPDSVFALSIGRQLTGFDYYQAQKQRTRAMVFMEDIFNDVDCILTPGLGMKVPIIMNDALKHGEANTMLMGRMMRYMGLGNLTGIPGITFPVGYDTNGLPISLQVMSGWWKEHIMLRVAHACEGFVEHQRPMIYYDILG